LFCAQSKDRKKKKKSRNVVSAKNEKPRPE